MTSRTGALALLLLSAPAVPAQVVYPPRPDAADVHVRYRIRADRDERIRQFRAMTQRLAGLGFVAAPREDADLDIRDPAAELTRGTIPTAGAFQLLGDPRVQTVVATPTGYALPEDSATPVPVRVWLATGLAAPQQRELHTQTVRHLGFLGFKEGIAYDHRGYAVARGTIPAGELFTLLKDLRTQPTGWFLPAVPRESLPSPFRDVLPVRYVEVVPAAEMPAAPAMPPTAPAPAADPSLDKLTTDVKQVLADMAAQGNALRVELVLHDPPGDRWEAIRTRIRTAADGLNVEGQIGVVVTARLAKGADVAKVAALEEVRAVRLPRAGPRPRRGRRPSP